MVDVALDEGGLTNQNARAEVPNHIYDTIGFSHIYKG